MLQGTSASVAQLVEHHVANVIVSGSTPVTRSKCGSLAQSVEQGTENPRVPSSILGAATIFVSTPVQVTGFFVFSPKDYPQKTPCGVSGRISATPNPGKVAHLLRFFENYLCQLRF